MILSNVEIALTCSTHSLPAGVGCKRHSNVYAHSLPDEPPHRWQVLEAHLKNVANLGRIFADSFGASDWGYLGGLWHDIGKYSQEFQDRLSATSDPDAHIETKAGRVDHSTAGAKHACSSLKDKGKLLAYAIAGHHAGLPDGKSNESSCLSERLVKSIPSYSSCPESILNSGGLGYLPISLKRKRPGFQLSFFARMVFSCLVDADFLDTEAFMDPARATWRKGYPALNDLDKKLTAALHDLTASAPSTRVNQHRRQILEQCIAAASCQPGLFSLTVPTGGGKTLSSLAFGLKHALKYGKTRIIYVIPYTSIIEQNAAVFREILGDEAVLEHHSNYEPHDEDHRSRLASENWDAPLVVTTNVQFFESLFSSKPSRCRKLHHIANSVVILDEAQMLPIPLLRPCMEALRELSENYKTTILLCTATQPALSTTETFRDGLDNVREIIASSARLYEVFKRVRTECLDTLPDDDLVQRLMQHEQVLCVVSTRRHARDLFRRLPSSEGSFHLSALMCPAHRTEVLRDIRAALGAGGPCRVITTQLIEAGVDIDFPVCFRSLAGIDSLAQAAGRCNREGRLDRAGQFFVFFPEVSAPRGHLRQTAQTAEGIIRRYEDPLCLEAVEEYFRTLYWIKGEYLDAYGILQDLEAGLRGGDFPYRVVNEKFRIIADGMESIIIPWNKEARRIINDLTHGRHTAFAARKAQRFTVQVPPQILTALEKGGAAERVHDQYCILANMRLYHDDVGLCSDDTVSFEAEDLIV